MVPKTFVRKREEAWPVVLSTLSSSMAVPPLQTAICCSLLLLEKLPTQAVVMEDDGKRERL
jgi:predicted permease